MISKAEREEIIRSTDIAAVIGSYVKLQRDGKHYKGCCPFHEERTPSFVVTPHKHKYKCFGCGVSGDALTFLIEHLNIKFPEAVKMLKADAFDGTAKDWRSNMVPLKDSWVALPMAEREPSQDELTHYKYGLPSKLWWYHTADGVLAGAAARFDFEDGSKDVLPLSYCTDGSRSVWKFRGMAMPRPLFMLPEIANSQKPVLVVEGEKTAQYAMQLFPVLAVTTWPGGGQAYQNANWEPLAGRRVVLSPDNDAPGYKVMIAIADKLKELGCQVRWLPPPAGVEKGWDWADYHLGSDDAMAYAKANMMDVPPHGTLPVIPDPTIPEPPQPDLPAADDVPPPNLPLYLAVPEDPSRGFKFLGWEKSDLGKHTHHFYSYERKAIISSSAAGMNTNLLIELAPLNFWEIEFPGDKKGVNLNAAVNWLIRNSAAQGAFDPSIRGRGAWMDRGRVVIHNGSYLIVDGVQTELEQIASRHIYETAKDLGITLCKPTTSQEGHALLDLVRMVNWERDINAALLLGWCVLAPICGALTWRPHIWLTGPSGSGKSWVFLKIVRRLLGGIQLAVQGDSTEAGLRQTLGHDAIPVVFDEAENEDRLAAQRMQNVLALMRTASAEDGGSLLKGSAGGHARSFRIRSCFAYASIVVQVKQQADRNRVTILGMLKKVGPEYDKRFQDLERMHTELVTNEFVQRLQSRTLMMMPIILQNITIFRSAATAVLGDSRAGDQLGTLLAGAYSLISDRVVLYDEAVAWMHQNEWVEERGLDLTKDETALLNHIVERKVSVEVNGYRYERNVGELIQIASGQFTLGDSNEVITQVDAQRVLGRMGILIGSHLNEPGIIVSNNHTTIKEWLSNTPWGNNHGKLLQRLTGAVALDKPFRFTGGGVHRAVWIPLHYFS